MPNIMKNQFEKKSQSAERVEDVEDVSKAATEIFGKRASQDDQSMNALKDEKNLEDGQGKSDSALVFAAPVQPSHE